jgi:sulfite reductase (ferredoxin)
VTVTAGVDDGQRPEQGSELHSNRSFSPCLATGAERSKFEQLKADSAYLRDPLASELENELPNFSDGAVQLLKFHGSYQQDNRENRQKGQ